MKKIVSTLLLLLSLAFFTAGVYFVEQGLDKKDNVSVKSIQPKREPQR